MSKKPSTARKLRGPNKSKRGATSSSGEGPKSIGDAAAAVEAKVDPSRPGKALVGLELEAAIQRVMNPEVVKGPNVDTANGFKCTTGDQLRAIVKGYDSRKASAKSASGDVGAYINKQVEEKNLDKSVWRALQPIRKLNSRQLTLLMKAIDDLGLFQSAAEQLELFAEARTKTDEKKQADLEDAAANPPLTGQRPAMRLVDKDTPAEGNA